MSEDTKVRSESPELAAMTLPQLKKVATQLGIDGAAKMAKGSLVDAIADLQAKNREAAKAEKEAARAERDARRAERNNHNGNNRNQEKDSDSDGDDRSERNERNDRNDREDNEDGGSRRNRDRHRGRDRHRNREDRGEPTISEDDVLLPVGGLLDILENYAFVRTSGYLPSPNDVYVSMQQVRKFALRKGDVLKNRVTALISQS
jgi:transcription termination factor Rho